MTQPNPCEFIGRRCMFIRHTSANESWSHTAGVIRRISPNSDHELPAHVAEDSSCITVSNFPDQPHYDESILTWKLLVELENVKWSGAVWIYLKDPRLKIVFVEHQFVWLRGYDESKSTQKSRIHSGPALIHCPIVNRRGVDGIEETLTGMKLLECFGLRYLQKQMQRSCIYHSIYQGGLHRLSISELRGKLCFKKQPSKSIRFMIDQLKEWVYGRKSLELLLTQPRLALGCQVWVPGNNPFEPCYIGTVSDVNEEDQSVTVSKITSTDSTPLSFDSRVENVTLTEIRILPEGLSDLLLDGFGENDLKKKAKIKSELYTTPVAFSDSSFSNQAIPLSNDKFVDYLHRALHFPQVDVVPQLHEPLSPAPRLPPSHPSSPRSYLSTSRGPRRSNRPRRARSTQDIGFLKKRSYHRRESVITSSSASTSSLTSSTPSKSANSTDAQISRVRTSIRLQGRRRRHSSHSAPASAKPTSRKRAFEPKRETDGDVAKVDADSDKASVEADVNVISEPTEVKPEPSNHEQEEPILEEKTKSHENSISPTKDVTLLAQSPQAASTNQCPPASVTVSSNIINESSSKSSPCTNEASAATASVAGSTSNIKSDVAIAETVHTANPASDTATTSPSLLSPKSGPVCSSIELSVSTVAFSAPPLSVTSAGQPSGTRSSMQYYQKKKLRTQFTTAASSSPSSAGVTDQSLAAYYHQQQAAVLAAAMGNQQALPQQLSAANPPGATPSAGGNSGALDLKMRKETTKVSAAGREMQANLSGLDLKNSLPQAYGFGVPPSTSSLHGYHAAGAEEMLEKRATVAPTVTSNSLLMSQHHGSQTPHLMPQNVLMAAAAVAQQQQQQHQHQKQQQQQHLRNVSAAMSRSGQSNFPLVAPQSPHANPPPPPPPPTSAGVFPHPVASTYLNNPLLQQHVANAGSQAAAVAAHAAASARYPQRGTLFDQQQQQQLMTMLAHHPNFMSYLQGDVSKSLEISENYSKTFKDRYSTINAPPEWYGSLLTGAPYSANNPLGAPGVIPPMAQTPHASPQAAPQHSPVGATRHHLRPDEEARLCGRSSSVKDAERSLQHKERHEKSLSQASAGRRVEERLQPGTAAIPPGQPHHHHPPPPPPASHHSSVAASVAPVLQDSTAAAVDQHFSKSLKLISQRSQQQQPSTTRACLTNAMVAASSTPTSTSVSAVPQPAHHQNPQPIISQPVVSQPLPSLPPQHRSASVSAASLPRTSSNSQSQPRRPSESSGTGNNTNLPQLIFSQLARDSSNASARTSAASLSSALPQVSHASSSSTSNSSNGVSIGQALNTMLDLTVRQSMGGATPMDEDGNSQSAARRILSALGSSASSVESRRSSPPNHQRQQPTPTTQQQHHNSVPPALTPMRPVEGNSASSNSPPGSLASSLSHAGTPGGVTVSAGTATWTAPSMEAGEISVSPAPSEDTTTFVKYRGGTKKAWLKQFHTVDTRTSEQVVDGATDSVSSMSRDEAPSSSASNTSVSPPLGSLPVGHKTAALDPPNKMKLEPLEITAPSTDDSRSKPRRGMKRRRGAGSVSPSASTGSLPNGINGLVKPEPGHTAANTKSPTRKRKRRGAAGGVSGGSEESSEDRGDSASSGNCVGGNNGMEKGPWRPESILQAPPNYSLLACKAMNKSELDRHRETLAAFIQWQSCSEAAPKQVKCRECRLNSKNSNNETSSGRSNNKASLSSPASPSTRNGSSGGGGPNNAGTSNIFCRFYAFRRLRYNRKGVLTTFGFSDGNDARPEDVSLWLPHYPLVNMGLDRHSASYLLRFVGDNFISLVEQERYAKENVRPSGNNGVTDIAWKRAVSRVREMCDVCDTTLFNMHWTCNKCGYAVCLDCFKYRQPRFIEKANGESKQVKVKNYSNEHEWLSCSASRQAHDPDKLMLTEIIPGNALWLLERAISELRPQWLSRVPSSLSPPADGHPASSASSTSSVPGAQSTGQRYNSDSPDALSVLADVATASDATSESAAGGPPPLSPLHLKHYTPRRGLQPAILGRERPVRCRSIEESRRAYPEVEHSWLCDGRLLRLHEAPPKEESINGQHVRLFQEQWQLGQPILVSNCCRCFNPVLWNPKAFSKAFGSTKAVLMNCKTGVELVGNPMKVFWDGFECMKKRLKTASGDPMVLKLKDWPPGDDFCDILPDRYADLMSGLPLPQYTSRSGSLNLASRLPEFFVRPDLGPKMYNAYGLAREAKMATTNLHLDMADAVNVLLYVGVPEEMGESEAADVSKALRDARLDEATRERLKENAANVLPGALWHLFDACDADKIRDFLNKVAKERGMKIDPDHDPIHDQSWYLDQGLLERLREEYSVEGYTIVQCLGDAIFIPAGAPHQVRNLHSCIKVAEDFVSPENVHHCLKLTHEFRLLSSQHANHEDKLQVKNMLYHAIKDAVAVMLASKGLKEEEPPTS